MASMIDPGSHGPEMRERSPGGGNPRFPDGWRDSDNVIHLIEDRIIPQLLVAHSRERAAYAEEAHYELTAEDVDAFATMTLAVEADELLRHVEAFMERGASPDAIFIDLLAPTARRLGAYWEEDRCDFVEVTMGLWRLQELMREVASHIPTVTAGITAQKSALFAPYPGDQHSFGTLMVEEFFARAGWETALLIEPGRPALLDRLTRQRFDIVGLTISNDCESQTLEKLIKGMRSISKNPNIRVLIGGRVVNESPEIAEQSGADGTATNAKIALDLAEELVDAYLSQEVAIT